MAKQGNAVFLEDWLKAVTATGYGGTSSSSARAIIQHWADLRDSLKTHSFHPHHLQALSSLVASRLSLHVADPQAKLALSVLSSPGIALPDEAYPLLLRLLYVWVRKSARPTLPLVDSVVEAVSRHVAPRLDRDDSPRLFSEAVLLLGAVAFVPAVAESTKRACLEIMCGLLEQKCLLMGSCGEIVPDVLAGIGYALSSSESFHYARMLDSLLGVWGKIGGPGGDLSHGIMVLHLVEWVSSCLINSRSVENISIFSHEALETQKENYAPFAVVMASAGVLRTLNKSATSGPRLDILSRLRRSAEERIESVGRNVISQMSDLSNSRNDLSVRFFLQCFSIALARSGPVSPLSSLFSLLASALLTEIFPLKWLYAKAVESLYGNSVGQLDKEVKEHLEGVLFKEAGAVARVLCNQYSSADEQSQSIVENLMWNYCQFIYLEHRKLALLLRGEHDELLMSMEKIVESAFLTVVFFALSVTKHKLNAKLNHETETEIPVKILVAFSCLEYFRRVRLPEYMDTIRAVVLGIQENGSSCVSFVESIPNYADFTNGPDLAFGRKTEYVWYRDEVQTARVLFYLRVIATCIEVLPSSLFGKLVAPKMFLYLGHPNGKVARASHSIFAAFISSESDSDQEERASLKEQLVFYYTQRSLSGYPDITPFEGMASGITALVRQLPAGSPATLYCIHSLVEKAHTLCREVPLQQADTWKNWQGESEHCKKILDLLLRLMSLVDIQVLPDLMKLMAQLIVELPKDGQVMILNELYSMVAESDDVTRKPTLVSWLQSLSYLCFQNKNGEESKTTINAVTNKEQVSHGSINARL